MFCQGRGIRVISPPNNLRKMDRFPLTDEASFKGGHLPGKRSPGDGGLSRGIGPEVARSEVREETVIYARDQVEDRVEIAAVVGLEDQGAGFLEDNVHVEEEGFGKEAILELARGVERLGVENPYFVQFGIGEEAADILRAAVQEGDVVELRDRDTLGGGVEGARLPVDANERRRWVL